MHYAQTCYAVNVACARLASSSVRWLCTQIRRVRASYLSHLPLRRDSPLLPSAIHSTIIMYRSSQAMCTVVTRPLSRMCSGEIRATTAEQRRTCDVDSEASMTLCRSSYCRYPLTTHTRALQSPIQILTLLQSQQRIQFDIFPPLVCVCAFLATHSVMNKTQCAIYGKAEAVTR